MESRSRCGAAFAAVAVAAALASAQAPRAAVHASEPGVLRQVGIVELRSEIAPGSCVDANALSGAVVLWSCHGGANQRFAYFNDRTLRHAGRCIGVDGKSVVLKACNGMPDTRWRVTQREVRNAADQCIDIAGGQKANGTPLLAWHCRDVAQQRWTRR